MLTFFVAVFVLGLIKLVIAANPRSALTIVTVTYSHCVPHEATPPAPAYEGTETCTRSWTFHGDHQDTVALGTPGRSHEGTFEKIINPDAVTAPPVVYYLLIALAGLTGAISIGRRIRWPGRRITASYPKP